MPLIEEALVPRWAPEIVISNAVADGERLRGFVDRAPAKYLAPAIGFGAPEAVLVVGGSFAVLSRTGGLIEDSVHMLGRFDWPATFAGLRGVRGFPAGDPAAAPLVVANAGHDNYFHWTVQTLATVLIHRLRDPAGRTPLVLPRLAHDWQRQSLALFGIDNPRIELAPDEAGAFDAAILTNMTGGHHAFAPHPAVLEAFQAFPTPPAPGRGPRIYLSRLEAGDKRRMENEAALAALLSAHGFAIVDAGALTVAEQGARFRHAGLIVAPHGAALVGLVHARPGRAGPRVIELLQENYLNRCFVKLGQGKGLRYTAVVNPCVSPGTHHHNSTWAVDLPLVERLVARL